MKPPRSLRSLPPGGALSTLGRPGGTETSASIVIQQPTGTAEQLILLFHGVGGNAQNMVPLGQHLANEFTNAHVVSVDGPLASDLGAGRQWFSGRGVTEENRVARVEAAMPEFQAAVRHWQGVSKVGVEGTALVGFSQGAIMALESTQQSQALARRVIAIAGRFAQPPRSAPPATKLHLIHGEQDPVIPPACSVDAARRLQALGAEATIDLIPMLGHSIDAGRHRTDAGSGGFAPLTVYPCLLGLS